MLIFKQVNYDECEVESSPSTKTIYKTSPPINTLAVIVNISNTKGSLKVHQTSDNN
ncbi:hypothetical protein K469DRAFT_603340 [Zopfia rhizophila CBS 207.26]|uniref:Uncharacterized protein n=1 Tax=Zopfia rhizophila CBS 207.26 TaxID=1314779 RepID=A0A6A6DG16_9PEZI|nr:hypothetical protein K469DRAFT_603340 [Zopfia rhizophila CBS 207.26]